MITILAARRVVPPDLIAPAARLKRYAPGLRQPVHAHDAAHLSLILAGGFEETDFSGDRLAMAGAVGLRPDNQ